MGRLILATLLNLTSTLLVLIGSINGFACGLVPKNPAVCIATRTNSDSFWESFPKEATVDLNPCFPPLQCQFGGTCWAEASKSLLEASIAIRDKATPKPIPMGSFIIEALLNEPSDFFESRLQPIRKHLTQVRLAKSLEGSDPDRIPRHLRHLVDPSSDPKDTEKPYVPTFFDRGIPFHSLKTLLAQKTLELNGSVTLDLEALHQNLASQIEAGADSEAVRQSLKKARPAPNHRLDLSNLAPFMEPLEDIRNDHRLGRVNYYMELTNDSKDKELKALQEDCARNANKAIRRILAHLCTGTPVGATVRSEILRKADGTPYSSSQVSNIHAVVIQGVENNSNGQPEFVVRNSWGSMDRIRLDESCGIGEIYGISQRPQNEERFLTEEQPKKHIQKEAI